jgi:hypothetical protein
VVAAAKAAHAALLVTASDISEGNSTSSHSSEGSSSSSSSGENADNAARSFMTAGNTNAIAK